MKTFLHILIGILAMGISGQEAKAIPAFARNLGVSCSVCHSMTPRLNAFGEAFRLNGYKIPDPERPGPKTMKEWIDTTWSANLPEPLPVSVRNRSLAEWKEGEGDPVNKLSWEWEVFIGAALGQNLSLFGHYNLIGSVEPFEDSQDREKVQTKLIAWVNFHNLGRLVGLANQHLLNLRLGTIGSEEHDLPHYRSHSPYRFWETKALVTEMNVAYPSSFVEKNLYTLRRGPGMMLFGFSQRLQYSFGYQIGMQEGGGTDQQVGFTQIAYKISGMDLYGNTDQQYAEDYEERSLGLGMFASMGRAKVQPSTTSPRTVDSFRRLGFDARWRYDNFVLHGGTVFGTNDNPYGSLNAENVNVRSWFVAPEYYWSSQVLTGVRYEQESIDVPSTLNLGDRHRARINVYQTLLLVDNFRFTLEGLFYTDKRHNALGEELDSNRAFLEMEFTI
ncbi:MAG: hypothetical protein HY707_10565 [Ignavibacteriae bacterium]|nr:hypothetical protein [Ignavibacteriota bacterium]